MKSIRNRIKKQFGYVPTDQEILTLYKCGSLRVTDKEENNLLKYFNL